MCQLTYANLHEPYLNSLAIYLLGKIGSAEKHDDGVGFICPSNKIWKSEKSAHKITNLGNIISNSIVDGQPIPFHIRQATWGIEVKKENSHPFDGKHFILMHNGTLLPRNGEEPVDKNKDSDSLKFLQALDKARDDSNDGTFEEIFNKAMEEFAGKFAFIIREKETNKDYIVRGRTAELWIVKVTMNKKEQGYLVNTSKDTLKEMFFEFTNIWDLFYNEEVEFSEPKLLNLETIYVAEDEDVKKIGTATEVTPIKVIEPNKNTSLVPRTTRNRSYNDGFDEYVNNKDIREIIEKAAKVHDYLSEHSMGLIDFQIMLQIIAGVSILEITEEDMNMFIDYEIPKISANKKVRGQVKKLLNDQYFPNELYKSEENPSGKLEYPWPVNSAEDVINALTRYINPFA
jgi:predicted glutamine amidotransferase